MKRIFFILLVSVLFSCNSKAPKKQQQNDEKLNVITVNYPLFYFAERIAGDMINLQYVIPNDVDPAYWVPNDRELGIYQSADLIIANGADYAQWMKDVSLPSSRIINTSAEFENELIQLKNLSSHNHGPEGEHAHAGYAFTTWLNFKIAIQQAATIKNTLISKLPEEKEVLSKNFEALKKDLEKLDTDMMNAASKLKNINLIGSHPVYQYLSKGYNLTIPSVHFEPNEIPTEKQWETLTHLMNTSKTNLMLWEDSPIQEIENRLMESKINIKVFNPCGNKPINGDFFSVMSGNIDEIKIN